MILFILFTSAIASSCESDYDATFCGEPRCCTEDGFCAVYTDECFYSAANYSCYYASCEYCCYSTGYGTECGTYEYCVTWLIIGLTLWFLLTAITIYLIVSRKRATQLRMLAIAELAKRAQAEELEKELMRNQKNQSMGMRYNQQPVQESSRTQTLEAVEENEEVDSGPVPQSLIDEPLSFNEVHIDQQDLQRQYQQQIEL